MHFAKKKINVQAFVNLHNLPINFSAGVDNTFFKKPLLDFILL